MALSDVTLHFCSLIYCITLRWFSQWQNDMNIFTFFLFSNLRRRCSFIVVIPSRRFPFFALCFFFVVCLLEGHSLGWIDAAADHNRELICCCLLWWWSLFCGARHSPHTELSLDLFALTFDNTAVCRFFLAHCVSSFHWDVSCSCFLVLTYLLSSLFLLFRLQCPPF